MVKLVYVKTQIDLEHIKRLFLEYAGSLEFDLHFQNFEAELRTLPGDYAPPAGCMVLAMDGDEAVGCVALRPLTQAVCEMKRLYVQPGSRGKGIGRMLADAVVCKAAGLGYTCMKLDTVSSMTEAKALYESMGFKQIEAYRHNPVAGAVYFELDLVEKEARK
ncbi:MAG: GNAT family N-acetyltransferase [Deltaproteobacteria bacterium]|nr:GNAT family N-acetyltransferase [Deltaproteobacteria bacterium]MBW1994888.1 GNAT family N-acetyltransferase [Deltaproteobacteria bacterium]MBW2152471.1 GNAT family N-acetyltransferase [Deltaproteobacteria bacterium]